MALRGVRHLLVAGLLALAVVLPSVASALDVPLQVADTVPGGLARHDEPVTSGVPLPKDSGLTDLRRLGLFDAAGRRVAAQFRALSRWEGTREDASKALKWVLVDFRAEVPAGGHAGYVLRDVPAQAEAAPARLAVERQGGDFVVDTGAARFTVRPGHFNVLDKVELRGQGGWQPLVDQHGTGGLVLYDAKGVAHAATASPAELAEVEESGPLRCMLRVRGTFQAADGSWFAPAVHHSKDFPRFDQPYAHSFVNYEARMVFYAGKPWARLFLTLENNGANGLTHPEELWAPVQAVPFDGLGLEMGTGGLAATGEPLDMRFQGGQAAVAPGQQWELRQDWHENLSDTKAGTLEPEFAKGPFWQASLAGRSVAAGKTNDGWFQLRGAGGGMVLAARYFWQNHPKAVDYADGRLTFWLWPRDGYYPHCLSKDFPDAKYGRYCREAGRDPNLYLLDGGRHKTHELLLDFALPGNGPGSGPSDAVDPEALAKTLAHPLMALAAPQWYVDTGTLGPLMPPGLHLKDPEQAEALERWKLFQQGLVDSKVARLGWSIPEVRTRSPAYWDYSHQDRYFGWMHFGDLLWSGQIPSSLHYDWTLLMLLDYLRTGNAEMLELGTEMARHRYDIDQYHGERTDQRGNQVWTNGFQFYESEGHADPTINGTDMSRVSMRSHTWNGGLLLYHLLTGDPRALEAAEENAQAAHNLLGPSFGKRQCVENETRQETWPILMLVNLYRVTGETRHLALARHIAVDRMLYREQLAGGQGRFGNGDCPNLDLNVQNTLMLLYSADPLIQLHQETHDKDIGGLLTRMATFARDQLILGGQALGPGRYVPLQTSGVWLAGDPAGKSRGAESETIKDIFAADLLAYGYRLTGDESFLQLARRLFRDAVFYAEAKRLQPVNPAERFPVGYIDGAFPSSETKARGWLCRLGQVYLNTEGLLASGRPVRVSSQTMAPLPYAPPAAAMGQDAPGLLGRLKDGLKDAARYVLGHQ